MTDPLRVKVCGPLELYARDFGAELLRLGYTRVSAAFQLRLMAHSSTARTCATTKERRGKSPSSAVLT